MGTIKCIENFIFPEEDRFLELFIMSEMDTKEAFEKLKREIPERIQELHANRVAARYIDYALLEKDLPFTSEYGGEYTYTLTLEIGMTEIDSKSDYDELTFSEYLRQLEFRVICMCVEDLAGDKDETSFPITAQGLLEAIILFNKLKIDVVR